MEIYAIGQPSTPPGAWVSVVGGYGPTTPVASSPHQVQNHQVQTARGPLVQAPVTQVRVTQVRVTQARVQRWGASVIEATGVNSFLGSVSTIVPTVRKPFMDAARGVPPRGRPV